MSGTSPEISRYSQALLKGLVHALPEACFPIQNTQNLDLQSTRFCAAFPEGTLEGPVPS